MIQPRPQTQIGEPTWEIAELFPVQGDWTEEEYLQLDTNRLVELSDRSLEVLPMPTELHQIIALFLYEQLRDYTRSNQLGLTLAAPLRVRLWKGKMREPDVVFMLSANRARRSNAFWDRADLVMEVVSDDDPDRDRVIKRDEYARAGIAEYWIIEPQESRIRVLCLDKNRSEQDPQYEEFGCFTPGQHAGSNLLPGFTIDVREALLTQREY